MRAKVKVESVCVTEGSDTVRMRPVTQSDNPEDNSYARYTPNGLIELQIDNPNLRGKVQPGDVFYVDFSKVT